MIIKVSNKLIIKEPTIQVKQYCVDNLVMPNPDYHKKVAMGKYTGNTPKEFALYEKNDGLYYLPFGCLNELFQMYKNDATFERDIATIRPVKYDSIINLYPYQEEAVLSAYKAKNGILVMPCGAGKTQTALELIARLGCKTLWLTHTQDLLTQSRERAKNTLGIASSTYGRISDGKINIGSGITFATVQTMVGIDLSQYKYEWDCIIVDEVQHAVGSPTKCMQFYKVLSALSCRYKYGLTATPKRADGLEKSMFALIGGIIHTVSRDAVKDTTCPVKVIKEETGWRPNPDAILAGDGTIVFSSLVDDMVNNEGRFTTVLDYINRLDGTAIVLANRVEYLERLMDAYNGKAVCLSLLGNSKKGKELRKQALAKLNAGELDCIFATYKLAKEGLDVPSLRYVVFATPEKDETTVIQSAGRVGRKSFQKPIGTVIDFVDDFGMLRGWWNKRKNMYKKLDYHIDIE